MVNPNFKSINSRNYKEYGLSEERFEELQRSKIIIIGSFIDGLPVVFHTDDKNQTLQDFMQDSIKKYNELLKSAERLNNKSGEQDE